tara:strand:- start:370 stop:483 length:114 start_codon:yes stop_codon:yes gene_type:complete
VIVVVAFFFVVVVVAINKLLGYKINNGALKLSPPLET